MIIDMHAHNLPPGSLNNWYTLLCSTSGSHGHEPYRFSDDEAEAALTRPVFRGKSLIEQVQEVGTDMQFLSPRPISMGHSMKPEKIVHWYIEAQNDVIAKQVAMHQDMFRGVCGLPQNAGVSPANSVEELKRCVKELGFVGCLLNPDPNEGFSPPPPALGNEYWYPLYEALVELDVPALIHTTRCGNEREPYTLHFINEESTAIISLLESRVFLDFPTLKIVVSHGGGAIPYQIGRFRSFYDRPGRRPLDAQEDFDTSLRRLSFDTALYTKKALDLLFEAVGTDRCLFGTERPGTGTSLDPKTGKWMDDIKPLIEDIDWLTAEDRKRIFEDNARGLYKLEPAAAGAPKVART